MTEKQLARLRKALIGLAYNRNRAALRLYEASESFVRHSNHLRDAQKRLALGERVISRRKKRWRA